MVKRRLIIIAIFIVFLFSILAVSAGENQTDDAIVENTQENIVVNVTQTTGTFTQLSNSIKSTDEGYLLKLSRDYENDGRWNYINIDKRMGIDGQGHSIDAKSMSRVFRITGSYVLLKNITFVNGKFDDFYGGAIYLGSNSRLEIQDCNFINFSAESGGAIYCNDSSHFDIVNSNFINCSSEAGGAIYCDDFSRLNIVNSTFINCSARFGGAIYYSSNIISTIFDSNFTNNVAEVVGGSLFSGGGRITIERSSFTKSIARYESGGAFTFLDTIFNGHYLGFFDCQSEFGGAVTLLSSRTNITNSIFRKNSAKYDGGAFYASYGIIYLEDNDFSDNLANRGGAAFISLITIDISNNLFKNNSATTGNAAYALTVNDLGNISAYNYEAPEKDYVIALNNNLTITSNDYYQFQYRPTNITRLPSYYSMVDENLLTPVKDQGTEGNCWAFAAMAALESCILKASDLSLDLSEANLKNLMALYSSYGYNVAVNDGGHAEMTYGYLASWLGPIFDIDDEYYINDFLSPLLKSILHIQNIVILKRSDFTDNDATKNAIVQYGAVVTSMFYDDDYLNNGISYYFDGNYLTNHAVCIVGWDDSYSRYNFKNVPQGDGAWIVRNSWGPTWGDEGYFYVSYYDTKFFEINSLRSYTFILNDTIRLDRVYQYEIQKTTVFNFTQDRACFKNVFIVEGNEYLAAVSTIFVEECDYTVKIYVNDVLASNKTGKANEGYYTINLDNLIYLNRNDKVDVVFNCSNFRSGIGKLPASTVSNCTNLYVQSGNSFYWNNVRWVDLYPEGAVACIKMFTKFTNDHKVSPYLELNLDIDTDDGGYILEVIHPDDALGMLVITYNQTDYPINLSNTNSIKLYNLSNGDIIYAKYFEDDKYCERTVSIIVDTNIAPVGTFEDLTDRIRLMKEGEVLNLAKDYANGLSGDEIIIRKAITIDGQGHSINANHLSRIFNIQVDDVVLKNINFIGGYHDEKGSVLSISGLNCTVVNCSFTDSYSGKGGAIYWYGNNGIMMNSLFINNTASDSSQSAAVYWIGNNARISNSTFINNSANYGSAVIVYSYRATIEDCTFKYNHAYVGGAIVALGKILTITNSSFANNDASGFGGAIYLDNVDCKISKCSFNDNFAKNAGAIILSLSKSELLNCSFANNGASNFGGAVFSMNGTNIYNNCSFTDNYAKEGGAILSSYGDDELSVCYFANNTASESGGAAYLMSQNCILIDCTFKGNIAKSAGAILWQCDNGSVANSVFMNNLAFIYGGAVLFYSNGNMSYSHFKNNSAGRNGGAVYWLGDEGNLINSTFTDNGDAVCWLGDNGNLINSTFINNINSTQVIWKNNQSGTISGCRFINTTRNNVENAGAIFTRRNAGPSANDTTIIFNDPQVISVALNGVLYDLPITSDFIFDFTRATEFKTYRVNSTSLYEELFDLNAGEWTVNMIFEGDDNYCPFDYQFKLTVNPADSFVKINDTSTLKGHEVAIAANVHDINDKGIDEGAVSFYDDGVFIGSANVIEGVAQIIYTPQTGGKYTITAVYESGNYLKSNATATLTVESASIEISLENGTVGSNSTFKANVTELYSTVNTGTVTFYIDDEYLGAVSVSGGFASIVYVPLKAGNHVVMAVYSADSNFTDAEDSSSYHVEKADSILSLDDVNGTVGHNLLLTAIVTSSNNIAISEGKVTFRDGNDVIGTVDVKDGIAELTYRPSKDGEHTITAKYESDNYLSSNDDAKLFIDSLSLEIIADPGTVGFTSNLKVNVSGLYSTINEGSITFYLNGNQIGKRNVLNGIVTLDYIPLTSGSFNLKVTYGESDRFSDKESSLTYTVNKAASQVLIKDFKGSVASELTLTATVVSPNNIAISEGTVTFKDGNVIIGSSNVKNGEASVTYTPTKAGTYQITATFDAANYISSNNVSQASIDGADVEMTFDAIESVYYKSPTGFAINVLSNGKAVNEGSVAFYVNGQQIHYSTLQNGRIAFVYTFANAGAYDITAIFAESSNYNPLNKTASFTVMKLPTAISSSDVTTVYNSGGTVTVTLKDKDGNPLNGFAVSIDSKAYTTDSNGQVRISTNGWNPKVYVVPISFEANGNYDRSTSSVKVTVLKATPKLSASKKTFKRKVKTKKYTVTLKTNLNAPLAKVQLTIKVKGKTFKATTSASGKATFKIKKLTKKGTYKSVVTFAGNAQYNKVTKNVKITVK